MDDEGQLAGFNSMREQPAFTLPMRTKPSEEEFAAMAKAGFSVNAAPFRGFEPGRLLLNSIRLRLDGVVDATLTPLPQRADERIRRQDFADLFSGESA